MHNGIQRYRCKSCGRFFSDKARKFSYGDKCRALGFYLNNTGVRKTAAFMGCSPAMVVRWVREAARNLKRQLSTASLRLDESLPDVIELDEIYTKVKKTPGGLPYGLLILGGEARLLRL
jgi:transposase-like protein